jgi:hypothetical protein
MISSSNILSPRPSQTIITTQPLSHRSHATYNDARDFSILPIGTTMIADDRPGYRRIFGTMPLLLAHLLDIAIINDRLYVHGFMIHRTNNNNEQSSQRILISIPVIDIINQAFEYNDRMPITSIEEASQLLKWKCDHVPFAKSIRDSYTSLMTCVWNQRFVFVACQEKEQCHYYGIYTHIYLLVEPNILIVCTFVCHMYICLYILLVYYYLDVKSNKWHQFADIPFNEFKSDTRMKLSCQNNQLYLLSRARGKTKKNK